MATTVSPDFSPIVHMDSEASGAIWEDMADHIYAADGAPCGFRLSNYIYGLDGVPVGRVFAEKAYRLDGSYVGALINSMVLDKLGLSRRSIPSVPPPAAVPSQSAEPKRVIGQNHADCFNRLLGAVEEDIS